MDAVRLPLSPGQRGLWVIHQLAPESAAYNIVSAGRIRSGVSVPALQQAFQGLVDRHAILRTVYGLHGDDAVQFVYPAMPVQLHLTDCQDLTEAEIEARLLADGNRPFDLTRGPVIRLGLYTKSASDQYILLSMHHIASDYWSSVVLLQDLGALYQAALTGVPAALPPVAAQFGDFVDWQVKLLASPEGERLRSFWHERLGGDLPAVRLETDLPRTASPTYQGASLRLPLPTDLLQRLEGLSRSAGVTPYVTLLAAFQVFLHRYTGLTDLPVGSPALGRTRSEWRNTVGFLANPVVMRTEIDGAEPFRALLARVKQIASAALSRQDYPFSLLVDEVPSERAPGLSPLFQVMFAYNTSLTGTPGERQEIGGLALEWLQLPQQDGQYDLTLSIFRSGTAYSAAWSYRADLFLPATIERFHANFLVLLEGIAANPDQLVRHLPLLTEQEREILLRQGQAPGPDPSAESPVHRLIERQAAATPKAIAVVADSGHLTYRELNEQANRLAHALKRRGVAPQTPVGVFLNRTHHAVVSLLAVLKAGGCYVPLDSAYPQERLAYLLAETALPVVITVAELLSHLPGASTLSPILLDADAATIAQESADDPPCAVASDDAAYMIFTSGSTGLPKGVVVEHGALAVHCREVGERFELTARDQVLQFSSFTFDTSLEQTLPTLAVGATVVLRGDEVWSAGELLERFRRHGITVSNLPTAYWRQVVQTWAEEGERLAHTPLRLLIVGGEAMSPEPLERWRRLGTNRVRLLNAYGPTEIVVTSHTFAVTADYQPSSAIVPIGRSIGSRQCYVLDAYGSPVPIGAPGELYIGGPCIARGYLNRPELTAERFVRNPFGEGRLYRTGDLARYQPDGTLIFLGRLDNQVKIRGFRVEPGEVETALASHPAVAETVVLLREDEPGDKRLVAYYVAKSGTGTDAAQLRHFLQAKLPAYAIPAAFVPLDRIPLTINGKVDRRALPAPSLLLPTETAGGHPRTETEALLARIWADLLRHEQVGVHENFFALGGDSILAIQVVSRAARAGLRLTPKQLFDHQTVAELAAVARPIDSAQADSGPKTGPVLLTPVQRWFFSLALPEPHHFNQSLLLAASGPLAPDHLARALGALVSHHDALRLRFTRNEEGWHQRYADVGEQVDVGVTTLEGLTETEQQERITARGAVLQASLAIESGPLLRAELFERGAGQPSSLLLVIHHLAVDGVSWRILMEDLQTAYEQSQRDEAIELPNRTTSFQEWAAHLHQYATTPAALAEAAYWGRLSARSLPLPVDRTAGANSEASARTITVRLSAAESRALLQQVPTVYRTQINDALLTALGIAFANWTGQPTILVDLEGHGRESLDGDLNLSRTVGWFTAIYPVCVDLTGTAGPGEALKAVKEQLRQVPNNGIGYGLLRYLVNDQSLQDLPRAEVSFNYLGQFDQAGSGLFALSDAPVGPMRSPRGERSHLLNVDGWLHDDELHFVWTYSENRHLPETILALAERFVAALRDLIAHCQSPEVGGYTPSDFPLARLTQPEVESLTANRTVEEIYPLSPMQHGMLYHTLLEPDQPLYIAQFACLLTGPLERDQFRRSWELVMRKHGVLRTAIRWEGVSEPVQVVYPTADLPWVELDWRGIADQNTSLTALLTADRFKGFDLTQAPLMRLILIQLTDERWQFVWTQHHLIMDGWSLALILKDMLGIYAQLRQGQAPQVEPGRPYRDYIAWLQRQSLPEADAFWQGMLQGFQVPPPLSLGAGPEGARESEWLEEEHTFSSSETASLRTFARNNHLTLNTLVQSAWALLLSHYTGRSDVVFGATVSGRPSALPGIDETAGLFINTLPMRVAVLPAADLVEWLRDLQARHAEIRQFEHTPLSRIISRSGQQGELFESITVFENYPLDDSVRRWGGLQVSDVHSKVRANYPLVIEVPPTTDLTIQVEYDTARFTASAIRNLLACFHLLLMQMTERRRITIGDCLQLLADQTRRQQEAERESLSQAKYLSLRHARRKPMALQIQERGSEEG